MKNEKDVHFSQESDDFGFCSILMPRKTKKRQLLKKLFSQESDDFGFCSILMPKKMKTV